MIQALRYYKALQAWPELTESQYSLLEVRPGHPGIEVCIARPVTAVAPVRQPGRPSSLLRTVRGQPDRIPLPDDSYDIVLCTGFFEQLEPEQHPAVLQELIRVARLRIILICANGVTAQLGEQQLASTCRGLGLEVAADGNRKLPEPGGIFQLLLDTGLPFECYPNESFLQHYGGVLLDLVFPASKQVMGRLGKRMPGAPPFAANDWDVPYSFLFGLEKSPRRASTPVACAQPIEPACEQQALSLYSVYHRRLPTAHLGSLQPVYVGSCRDEAQPGELTDLPRSAPPLDNRRWSELSAIYALWRDGPRTAVVGFCHYRRLFDFRPASGASRETSIPWQQLENVAAGLQPPADLWQGIDDDTIMLPPPTTLGMTIWSHYCEFHSAGDYCELLNALGRHRPELLPLASAHFSRTSLYANNLFIMSWQSFDELCRLWFTILPEVESRLPAGRKDAYQARDISFLAERLFDLWIHYRAGQGARITHQPLFFVDFST